MAGEEIDVDELIKEKERLAAARDEAEKKLAAMDKDSQAIDSQFKNYEKMQQDMEAAFKELAKNSKAMNK